MNGVRRFFVITGGYYIIVTAHNNYIITRQQQCVILEFIWELKKNYSNGTLYDLYIMSHV